MPLDPNAPPSALPPDVAASVIGTLAGALSATRTDAQFVVSQLREPNADPALVVANVEVWLGALLERLAQAEAKVLTIPGVWAYFLSPDARSADWHRRQRREPSEAEPYGSLPAVLDMDAPIRLRMAAERDAASAGSLDG